MVDNNHRLWWMTWAVYYRCLIHSIPWRVLMIFYRLNLYLSIKMAPHIQDKIYDMLHQFFYRERIRKSFPVDREGLTVLKSILPCWWWENVSTKTREVLGNPSPTPERFPEGEAWGKSRGRRGWVSQYLLVENRHSLIINLSTGSGSENPSLWTGKEWQC